uniref:Uncharacterized protein n=1 Tax=Stomoxys calcitrans TaxID=35570 RepID=A0A1I8P924_STOCA
MDKSLKKELENSKEPSKEPKATIHSTTSSTPTTTTPALVTPSPSLNDDDLITTSTESSDAFDTWTLVTDKKKKQDDDHVEILANTESEDEEDEEEDEEDEEEEEEEEEEEQDDEENAEKTDHKQLQCSLHEGDVTTDELSDGISIISESESNGRLSPHPYLRDHLQDLNLKFATTEAHGDDTDMVYKLKMEESTTPPPVALASEQHQRLRQRPGRTSEASIGRQEEKDKAIEVASSRAVAEPSNMPPLVKRGLQGIFYVGVALAILAMIGRMRHPQWNNSNPTSEELQQKVIDMELQNNLMRAEIDLLNKQVNYLSNRNDPQQQHQKKSAKYKGQYDDDQPSSYEGKKFKAWSGNGETLRPVEITKEDLKRPYKCPDGSFKEFAGMCVENKRNEPNIVEQFEQVVEDYKQQSETIQAFEKVAQELHGLTENPFDQVQEMLSSNGAQEPDVKMRQRLDKQSNDFLKNKPIYEAPTDTPQQQQFAQEPEKKHHHQQQAEYRPSSPTEGHDRRKDYGTKDRYDNNRGFESKPYDKDYKKSHHHNNYDKHEHKTSFDNQSKERFDKFNKHQQNKDGKNKNRPDYKHDDEYNSKERFDQRSGRENSRERNPKRSDDNSRERYDSKERYSNKRSKDKDYSKERFNKDKKNGSGEWQQNYMKHRENVRKENEHKYNGENKNWFMKRGDSRENKRNGDIRYR